MEKKSFRLNGEALYCYYNFDIHGVFNLSDMAKSDSAYVDSCAVQRGTFFSILHTDLKGGCTV